MPEADPSDLTFLFVPDRERNVAAFRRPSPLILTRTGAEGVVHIGQPLHDDVVYDLLDHAVDEDSNASAAASIADQLVVIAIPPARSLVVKQVVLVGETAHFFLRYFSEGEVALVSDKRGLAAYGGILRQLIDPCLNALEALG